MLEAIFKAKTAGTFNTLFCVDLTILPEEIREKYSLKKTRTTDIEDTKYEKGTHIFYFLYQLEFEF